MSGPESFPAEPTDEGGAALVDGDAPAGGARHAGSRRSPVPEEGGGAWEGGRPGGETGLWPGDTGELPGEVRRVLVQLVRGPYVSQQRTPNLWATLVAHEAVVRSRLADLFLELAIDTDNEIAFARNARAEDEPVPAMMRRTTLSFVDTALLLHLRHLLLRASAQGERAFVSMEEIVDHIAQYRAPGDTDRALVAKRARASVKRMKEYAILDKTDTTDRFEIMAILGLIITPEVVSGLEGEYRAALEHGGVTTGLEGPDGAPDVDDGADADDDGDGVSGGGGDTRDREEV